MTDQTTPAVSESEMVTLNNSFDHAMRLLLETQRTINNAGVPPAALASALCASYVTYVAALVAATGMPKDQVATTCKDAIDTMDEFISAAHDRMVEEIAEAAK
jgi:hypothetical protein